MPHVMCCAPEYEYCESGVTGRSGRDAKHGAMPSAGASTASKVLALSNVFVFLCGSLCYEKRQPWFGDKCLANPIAQPELKKNRTCRNEQKPRLSHLLSNQSPAVVRDSTISGQRY